MMALGAALALPGAGLLATLLWTRPRVLQEGKGWYSFDVEGVPHINKNGRIFIRSPSIPVDINRLGEPGYMEMLTRESRQCMENPEYNSPYATDYRVEFVGRRFTPLEKVRIAVEGHVRDTERKWQEASNRRREAAERGQYLAP